MPATLFGVTINEFIRMCRFYWYSNCNR